MLPNKIQKVGRFLVYLVSILGTSQVALGQDCPLPEPDILIDKRGSEHRSAMRDFACSSSYEEHKNAYGGSAEANYKMFGGSGSYNQENYRIWKQSSCSSGSSDDFGSSYAYRMRNIFGNNQLAAYDACLQRQSALTCRHSLAGGLTNVKISWKLGARAEVSSDPVLSNFTLEGGPLRKGEVLATGDTRAVLKVIDPTSWANLSFNVAFADSDSTGCDISISPQPSLVEPPLSREVSGRLTEIGAQGFHSFVTEQGDMVEIRPVELSDNTLYFGMTVYGPDGSVVCDQPKWLGSSGATNGLVFPATSGEYLLVLKKDEEVPQGGPYEIRIKRNSGYQVSTCRQVYKVE